MARIYNDPAGGSPSSIGTQFRTDRYVKKALIEARELQYFMPLADVTSMPKHMGKKIKKYHYIPLLDDQNINDQGIDAAGATTTRQVTIEIVDPDGARYYGVGTGASDGAALTAAQADAVQKFTILGVFNTNYATTKSDVEGAGWTVTENAGVPVGGNLYGSSKDIGTIPGKMPTLTENGGRVNRVGFKRKEIEGTFEKYGFFDEYTQESVDFDTDADLRMHVSREMLNGAHEMTEDLLQIDLLNSAGVVKYAGTATADSEINNTSLVDYDDLLRLHIDLNNNRTPMKTRVITGTRMVDTRTVAGGRVLYCGSELQPTLEAMTDLHGNPAFVPVHQYAAGATILNGEIGAIGHFRIVIVPKMLCWEGAGAGTPAAGFWDDGSNYNVYPMLCIGDGSFSTIGFQTDGKTVKFKIYHKPPGEEVADRTDPYGETGFMSVKWYYGFFLQRAERIGLIKTAAKL